MTIRKDRVAFTLQEVADACFISRYDVKDFALHGKITAHVWIPMGMIEESYEVQVGNRILIETTEKPFQGYLPLHSTDVRKLLKYKKVNIRCFPGKDYGTKICLHPGSPDVEVFKTDIVILKDDLKKLQRYLGVTSEKPMKAVFVGRLSQMLRDKNITIKAHEVAPPNHLACRTASNRPASYDELFQSVYFNGKHYSFGGIQAEIVKQLHKAALDGHPRVHFKILIENSGANSMYMRDIFKSQPHWKELIQNDGNGYYWLAEEFVISHTIHED